MKSGQNHPVQPASGLKSGARKVANGISEWSTKHPVFAVVLISLLAVIINCYPVIFCGRSFVSPACAAPTVYDGWPPAPGMKSSVQPVERHESDTGAIMFWGVPVGFVESRSLLDQGTLPLWNRYSHAGDTLIGQGVSMLGDPLQLIVILGNGSAWAWDIKFLAAKFLFCVGFGLLILWLLGPPLSLLYAVLAAYCGAFFYIDNHPVFFVFSYAPWVLLSALAWLDPKSKWSAGWGLVWLLANFACFNAGHAEAAVVLIGGLNLAAMAHALARCCSFGGAFKTLAQLAVGTVLFLGLTAPTWTSFLAAMEGSYSLHSVTQVVQLPPAYLPGAFDDLFYLLTMGRRTAAGVPGTSLLVLAGCILAVLRFRRQKRDTFFWVNTGALFLWGGCVFGWIPNSILAAIPLLNRVGHTHTDFSYLLVIHLMIQSAFGFKWLAQEDNLLRAIRSLFWTVLIFAVIYLAYGLATRHQPIPWNYFICAGAGAIGAPWLFMFLKIRYGKISGWGWGGILVLGFVSSFRFALHCGGSQELLMVPGPRAALNAPSPSINKIQADKSGAFRVVGLGENLFGDYSAVYGLEDIRSCAPLSNDQYISLLQNFPGINFAGWVAKIVEPVQAQPLLNLLNVKYLLANPNVVLKDNGDYHCVFQSDFTVFENPEVWPRAFFSDKITAISSNEQFIQYLLKNGKRPFIALADDEIAKQSGLRRLADTPEATIAPATNYLLLPNSTAFDIHIPSAGVVCLTEEQAKDFMATANGLPLPVLTINRAFKGVYLDHAGDYHVVFTYRPRYWLLSCFSFWLSAIGAVIFTFINVRAARFGKKAAPDVGK